MQKYLAISFFSWSGKTCRFSAHALAAALGFAVSLALTSMPVAYAQSESAEDTSESVQALEESLQREKEELQRAVEEREALLADQAKVRDELETERKALEEKQEQLLELCEKHNDANPNAPLDCEKELEG